MVNALLKDSNDQGYVLANGVQAIRDKHFSRLSRLGFINLALALADDGIIEITKTLENPVYRIRLLTNAYTFFDVRFWKRTAVLLSYIGGIASGILIAWVTSTLI